MPRPGPTWTSEPWPLTASEVDEAIERLEARRHAMAGALLELDDHHSRRVLETTAVEGLTCERWSTARECLATLWAQFDVYRTVVGQIRSVRARRSRPSSADLLELTRLLTTRVVTPVEPDPEPERRNLTGKASCSRRITLDHLVAEMKGAFARIIETLAAVDQVWSDLGPQLEQARQRLRALEDLARDLGLQPTDPVAESVARCAARLLALGERLQADPLSLWTGATVDHGELQGLGVEIDRAAADLDALEDLRTQADRRLDGVAALQAEGRELVREAAALQEQVREKVSLATEPPVPRLTGAYAEGLSGARQLVRKGQWRRLSAVLDDLERVAECELEHGRRAVAALRRPLEERSELRGRLDAYRAKAFQLGRVEDTALEEEYQSARQLLWSARCDLGLAAAAVAAYQRAVNGSGGAPGSPGASPATVEDEGEDET